MSFSNARQHVPALFADIMRNHNEQKECFAGEMTREKWCLLKTLRHQMFDYRRAAEKALCWNIDKGNTA